MFSQFFKCVFVVLLMLGAVGKAQSSASGQGENAVHLTMKDLWQDSRSGLHDISHDCRFEAMRDGSAQCFGKKDQGYTVAFPFFVERSVERLYQVRYSEADGFTIESLREDVPSENDIIITMMYVVMFVVLIAFFAPALTTFTLQALTITYGAIFASVTLCGIVGVMSYRLLPSVNKVGIIGSLIAVLCGLVCALVLVRLSPSNAEINWVRGVITCALTAALSKAAFDMTATYSWAASGILQYTALIAVCCGLGIGFRWMRDKYWDDPSMPSHA